MHLAVSHQDHLLASLLLLKGADPTIANRSNISPLLQAKRLGFKKLYAVLSKHCNFNLGDSNIPQHIENLNMNEGNYSNSDNNENCSGNIPKIYTQPSNKSSGSYLKKTSNTQKISNKSLHSAKVFHTLQAHNYSLSTPSLAYLGKLSFNSCTTQPKSIFFSQDSRGSTLLMKAAAKGHLPVVESLISIIKSDCSSNNSENENENDKESLDRISLSEYMNRVDYQGLNALSWACLGSHSHVAKYLIQQGALIFTNEESTFADNILKSSAHDLLVSPIVAASYSSSLECIDLVVENKNFKSLHHTKAFKNDFFTAYKIAVWLKQDEVLKKFRELNISNDFLHELDEWFAIGFLKLKRASLYGSPKPLLDSPEIKLEDIQFSTEETGTISNFYRVLHSEAEFLSSIRKEGTIELVKIDPDKCSTLFINDNEVLFFQRTFSAYNLFSNF